VLYVDAATKDLGLVARAKRVVVDPIEREGARWRSTDREVDAARREEGEAKEVAIGELERAFRDLAEQAARDRPSGDAGAPYRGLMIAAALSGGILEIVPDPFPSPPKKRVLVADDDPATEETLARLREYDVVFARDGWTAIDHLTEGDFDLALCAVALGGFSGAKIYKLASKAKPDLASRFFFLANASAIASAPPSSASGRVLARPVDLEAVRALVESRAR
jgi:CheY-like chemotaxis protein